MPTRRLGPFALCSALTLVSVGGCRRESAPPPVAPITPAPVQAPATSPSGESIYGGIAPATVLVTTPWGLGSGVFVAPDRVLTNYHVVASGITEDYGIEATVTTVRLRDDGSVEPAEKLEARALEIDAKRDLAILEIVDPPRKFPAVTIATADPKPGRRVAALGNAGVGMGWALKRCSINAIGTLESQASAIFQAQAELPAEERARMQEELAKAAADMGRQIQTDCNILPGDSGGPLVDEESQELVGLNVSIRPAVNGLAVVGAVASHIHVAEIRDFLAEVPERPVADFPDPLDAADGPGSLVDADSDGEFESLGFAGICGASAPCQAAFIDLDQSSFRGKSVVPTKIDASTLAELDVELVTMAIGRMPRNPKSGGVPVSDLLVFADVDDDGKLDTLIVRDGETGGTRGYALGGDTPTRKPELEGFALAKLDTLFAKKRLARRAGLVGSALAGNVVELDPDRMEPIEVALLDGDEDGVTDTIDVRTRLDRRILVDVDQDVLPAALAEGERARATRDPARAERRTPTPGNRQGLGRPLRRGDLHGELVIVIGSPTRVFYDTDHDGKYDLALEGASLEDGAAFAGFRLGTNTPSPTPAPEHAGLKLLRPALLEDPALARRLETVLARVLPTTTRGAAVEGAQSVPPPHHERLTGATLVPGLPRAVQVSDATGGALLASLDDKLVNKGRGSDPVAAAREGQLDAEFALRTSFVLAWAYYDTDDDGRFDWIAVSRPFEPLVVAQSWTLDRKGKLTLDTGTSGGSMLQPARFENKKLRKAFEEVVAAITSRGAG